MYNDDATPVVAWLADAQPEVAAACVLDSGASVPAETVRGLRRKWMPRLTDTTGDPRPEARAAVGRALSRLRLDDRPGVGLRADGLPDVAWHEIPPGKFAMGGDRKTERDAWAGAVIEIPHVFWLARYPVTCAQYRPFVEQGGYQERRFWTEAGWRWKGGQAGPAYWSHPFWHVDNHPVAGVTWYEAMAYCAWLSEAAAARRDLLPGPLREGGIIRLPLEAEWEKAARHPEGRLFPWGNDYRAGSANVRERPDDGGGEPCSLQRTTPVGLYPQGRSFLGLEDLAGNVFDWCLSKWAKPYQHPEDVNPEGDAARVTRGGSWHRGVNVARCAYREPVEPEVIYDDQGFRLCAAAAAPG
jgi:formylglycine-generating enzyme required for sulfatase activity